MKNISEYDNDTETRLLNTPPHSVEAEQSLLGGLMLENAAWDKIADVVSESDFYRYEHKLVFRIVADLINENRPADIVTVQEELERRGELGGIGGFDYLVTLAQITPSAANIRRYAEIVRERSVIRQLTEVGTEIARNAYNMQGKTANQLLDEAENQIFQIAENTAKAKQGFLEMPVLLKENIQRIDEL